MAERKRTGRWSNHAYGVKNEDFIGGLIVHYLGGEYELSPGSRGPFDVLNLTDDDYIVITQVKASRANSKHNPRVDALGQQRLEEAARALHKATGLVVYANIAILKGGQVIGGGTPFGKVIAKFGN